MWEKPGRLTAALWVLAGVSGCLVDVENQIVADDVVDERLVGNWKPVWRTEEEKIDDTPRYEDDIGVKECIVIGKSDDGKLQMTGIDSFDEEGIVFLGHFTGTTRKHGDRRFLLLKSRPFPGVDESDEDDDSTGQFVLEYEINENGDLFLWFLYIDFFEDAHKVHPIAFRQKKSPGFPSLHITATSEELLRFYADPKVSKLMVSAGKYRRAQLVPGNSTSIGEDP